MLPESVVGAQSKRGLTRAILGAGLVAGFLDITAAMTLFVVRGGKDPVKILNFIASGVFGKDGLTGGTFMAVMGMFFHMMIATIWAVIFFIAYPRLKILARNWIVSGVGYGIIVWLGMNLVVVPLSRTPPMQNKQWVVGMTVLIVCIGLPISFLARRYFRTRLQ